MSLLELQKHKCDICGTITTKPYKAKFSVSVEPGKDVYPENARSMFFEICTDCFKDKENGVIGSWFRKLWRKR